jgi:hypothetical protein
MEVMIMNSFFEELKKYFETTPQDKILEDWAQTEAFDNVGISVEEFLETSRFYYPVFTNAPNEEWLQYMFSDNLSPKFSSGFFITNKFSKYAGSSIFNS